MRPKGERDCKPTARVVHIGGVFDRGKAELIERLRQGPTTSQAEQPDKAAIALSQWRLASIRAAAAGLQAYSLSRVWRVLQRYDLKLRTASVQQYSPDPDYESKVAPLLACLSQTAQDPTHTVFLFLDEMGYYC